VSDTNEANTVTIQVYVGDESKEIDMLSVNDAHLILKYLDGHIICPKCSWLMDFVDDKNYVCLLCKKNLSVTKTGD